MTTGKLFIGGVFRSAKEALAAKDPSDIAATALFLCGDEVSMITGVALEVDGGRCI